MVWHFTCGCSGSTRVLILYPHAPLIPTGRELLTTFFKIKEAQAGNTPEHSFGALLPGLALTDANLTTAKAADCR